MPADGCAAVVGPVGGEARAHACRAAPARGQRDRAEQCRGLARAVHWEPPPDAVPGDAAVARTAWSMACLTRADHVLGHLPCTSRRNLVRLGGAEFAQPADDLDLGVVADVGRGAEEHLVEASRDDVERHATELAGETIALVAGAELPDRGRGLGDLVIERGEQVADGVLRLHASEPGGGHAPHPRVRIRERGAQGRHRRRAARAREDLYGRATDGRAAVAGVPGDGLASGLRLGVADGVERGLRQVGRQAMLQQLGDGGDGGRARLGGHAHVVERALDLRRVTTAKPLERVGGQRHHHGRVGRRKASGASRGRRNRP